MELRPHHLLCIRKFTGHGYDADFTEHMKHIVSELEKNPEMQITVSQGCDDICKLCPNKIGGFCTSLEKVACMDSAVLDVCSLRYGEKNSWADAASKARKLIFETDEFQNICACCEWFELCNRTDI